MTQDGGKPMQVLSPDASMRGLDISLDVTPDEVIALRKRPPIWPVFAVAGGVVIVLSPLLYSLQRELIRRGFSDYAKTLSVFVSLILFPTIFVIIATIRRRRLERGIKVINSVITVLTPDEGIGVTTFPLMDLKDVQIESEISNVRPGRACRLVLIRHVGGKVTAFRGMRYDDLAPVAKALYPRMRVRVKGFEVKTGTDLPRKQE